MKNLEAINPKNQSKVNRALVWSEKYDNLSTLRDIAEDNDNERLVNSCNNKCQNAWDKFETIVDELPKGQQKAIFKHIGL